MQLDRWQYLHLFVYQTLTLSINLLMDRFVPILYVFLNIPWWILKKGRINNDTYDRMSNE